MRRHLLAAGALLALLYVAGPAPAVHAADAWTAGPAAGGTRPAEGGRPYFYLQGAPGTVFEDKLSILNPDRTPRTVTLRAEDAEGAWIALASRTVRVPARTRADVPFTVTVPATAQPGDHPGTLVASAADGREQRTEVRLRVSGPTLAALSVEDVRIEDGLIRYALVNRGNTTLTPRVAVRADGTLGGELLRREPREMKELPPGRRAELAEIWTDTPALDRARARLTVTAGPGVREEATATATFVEWGPALGLGGGAAALLAAGGLGIVRHRKRAAQESLGSQGSLESLESLEEESG
ncbi:hypothetical protein GCM10010329_75450 [Streptomyces spiroverticillatus]|uniref:DUF916 domain-containing protein n=1 Tax=Streptomyces finlayi TaxID=67296 RepID=A0A918X7C3_9ACTN|nr:FixG Ig-like domain-containing protein [Streptomyces finlayi]GHA41297.1 hypothetical protein GCM10010329_75450 [Streptomyces spiroverticillatus]GHD16739.1 hypothetical protein GCM10010334_78030 [Streptomyces finlayi]